MFYKRPTILLFVILLIPSLFLGQEEKKKKTVAEISAMPDDTNKVRAYIALSKKALRTDYELAKRYGDTTLWIAEKINYELGVVWGYERIATAHYNAGDFSEAIRNFKVSLKFYEDKGDLEKAAILLSNIGLIHRDMGDYDTAMEYLFRSLEWKEKGASFNSMAHTHNIIGATYAIQHDFEKGEEYFKKALEGFRKAENTPMENSIILDLGGLYQSRGDLDKSLEYIKLSQDYFVVNGPKVELARSHYIMGNVYLKQENWDQGGVEHQKALDLYIELGHGMRIAGSTMKIGEVAFEKGELDKAVEKINDALELSKKIGTQAQISSEYILLSKIYAEKSLYKEALEYRILYESVRDSIINEENNKKIAELQHKYQTEKTERELAEVTALNNANELTVKRQNNQKIGLTALAIFILIIAIILFNQYRNKKKTNQVLQEKNVIIEKALDDKEILLKEIHHRVKNNLQFISSLMNLQTRHIDDENALRILTDSKNRVKSMAMVHQKLYQEDNLTGVDMKEYISNLLESLIRSYNIDREKVEVKKSIERITLDIDTAIPLGLILNELITNAFKYAFTGQKSGLLEVVLKKEPDQLYMKVSDNGAGIPEKIDPATGSTFGFKLIKSLAEKLKADLNIKNGKGTEIEIKIFS